MGFEQFMALIDPEIVVLIPVLMIIGVLLKQMRIVKNWAIPLTLGILGIIVSILILGFEKGFTPPVVLEGILQGILAAGMAVYVHQLKIQTTEKRLKE